MKTGKDYIDNTGDGTIARIIHIAEMNEIIEQIRREQHEATCREFEKLFACDGLVDFEDTQED